MKVPQRYIVCISARDTFIVIYFLLPQRSFLATDLLDHLPFGIKERASREPLCDLPLAESHADVALVLLPYRGLPFPNESFIQVVTLAKALRLESELLGKSLKLEDRKRRD
ncbi:hypothetical protein Tco_1488700 [Tanacetum coccineum]